MFGLLKNKLSGFIKSLSGRGEAKEAQAEQKQDGAPAQAQPEALGQKQEAKIERQQPEAPKQKHEAMPREQDEKKHEAKPEHKHEAPSEKKETAEPKHIHTIKHEPKEEAHAALHHAQVHAPIPELKKTTRAQEKPAPEAQPVRIPIHVPKAEAEPTPAETKKEEKQPAPAHVPKEDASASRPHAKTAGEIPPVQKKSIFDSIAGAFGAKKAVPAQDSGDGKQKPFGKEAAKSAAAAPSFQKADVPEKPPASGEIKPGNAPLQQVAAEQPKKVSSTVPKPAGAPAQPKPTATPVQPKHADIPSLQQPAAPIANVSPPSRDLSSLERRASSEKRQMAPKIGLGSTIKSFFTNEITIAESDVSDLVDELELSLLEADVAYEVSLEVSSQLRQRLVGMKVPKGEVEKRTKEAIAGILESVMESDRKFDFVSRVKAASRPAKILFVGPNGAGKTTTIAKMARKLMDSGLTVVLSASDTFRAAAIEQTEVHAGRLGVKVIKSRYGADPASVAFDAINYAQSHNIDVVLIDSAGRQDTNANLLSELKKIDRVAKPDIKIYVGESIGGNALIDQIKAFQQAIGIDGAILTKIDCDAKGGTAISISKSTGIPILFLGIGQRYEDLVPFDAHRIAQEIMN